MGYEKSYQVAFIFMFTISWLHNGLQVSIAALTIVLGLMLVYTTGSSLLI
jgi:hypothetical protein